MWGMMTSPGMAFTGGTTMAATTTSGSDNPGGVDGTDDTQPRVEFPETWIWTDATAGYAISLLCYCEENLGHSPFSS